MRGQSAPLYELNTEAEAAQRLSGVGGGGECYCLATWDICDACELVIQYKGVPFQSSEHPSNCSYCGVTTIGFDTETTSPTRGNNVFLTDEAELVGYSFSLETNMGFYVDAKDFGAVKGVLESPHITKVMHNAAFDMKMCLKYGVVVQNVVDTKLGAYLLGERATGLKDLTRRYLGIEPITYEEVTSG